MSFFNLEIHNYNANFYACEKSITEEIEKEIENKFGKEMLAYSQNLLSKSFANTVLRVDIENGGYIGSTPLYIPELGKKDLDISNFDEILIAFNKLYLYNSDEFAIHIANKVKDYQIIKKVKGEQKILIKKVDDLKDKIEKIAKL